MIKKYLYNLALGFDQFVNALLLGDPDESISGRCGRAILSGKQKWWVVYLARHIDWVFLHLFDEQNHTMNSVEPEESPKDKELWSWIHA